MGLISLLDRYARTEWPLPLPEGWTLRGTLHRAPRRLAVDANLLTCGRAVQAARLPFDSVPQVTVKPGSCALLLAAAVTVMADITPDAPALLGLAATLGFTPEKFLRLCPVQGEILLGDIAGRLVRDGNGQRAYYLGEPAALAQACSMIWDTVQRPMMEEDVHRIGSFSGYALATAAVERGVIGPAVYLGSLEVAEVPCPATLDAIEQLESEGLPSVIHCAEDPLQPGYLLISAEFAQEPCLVPPDPDAPGLAEAVNALRQHAAWKASRLRFTLQTMLFTALCGVIMQPQWWIIPLYALMVGLCCYLGGRLTQKPGGLVRRSLALLLPCLTAGLSALFLQRILPHAAPDAANASFLCLSATLLFSALYPRKFAVCASLAACLILVGASMLMGVMGLNALLSAFAALAGLICGVLYLAVLR